MAWEILSEQSVFYPIFLSHVCIDKGKGVFPDSLKASLSLFFGG